MSKGSDIPLVAITEHRREKEFKILLERKGARVISCPLLEERPVEDRGELQDFVQQVIRGEMDMMIFFTGVGVRYLADEALAMGVIDSFVDGLKLVTIVARGPKPRAALRTLGLTVDLSPGSPTSSGLLDLLATDSVRNRRIGVQLYGKPNLEFCRVLEARGAILATVQVYDYRPASDRDRVTRFVHTLLNEDVDIIAFTSAPQVESLFDLAATAGLADRLAERLDTEIRVAVIGEVANRALLHRGIHARILPKMPKLGALADAIHTHLAGVRG